MLQKIQLNYFNYANTYANRAKASTPVQAPAQKVSFKAGNELYEETVSLINLAREKAFSAGVEELKGRHDDGSFVTFRPTKKGMEFRVESDDPKFRKAHGYACSIDTKNSWVVWASDYPAFMLREVEDGEFDAIIEKYLPTVL